MFERDKKFLRFFCQVFMSIAMVRVESYVFNIPRDNLNQSPTKTSWLSPSDSSSIGKNSDDEEEFEDGGDETGENEAESPYKCSLDMMESLEEVLPVRKGISKFYNGKSKSFTNLTEEAASTLTSSASMKDFVKSDNPYSRRRRNLLCHQIWENNKTTPRGRISKKSIMSSSRSALTLAMAMASEGSSSGGDSASPTSSGSPPRQKMMLPPLYPRSRRSFGNSTSSLFAWRSQSVANFPRCFPSTASCIGSIDTS